METRFSEYLFVVFLVVTSVQSDTYYKSRLRPAQLKRLNHRISFSRLVSVIPFTVNRLFITFTSTTRFLSTKPPSMPIHSSVMRAALLASGLAARTVYAYTQVNVPSPFMYKNIDPIVFPGEYDKSHLHSFFGSDSVTVDTKTSDELRQGCTNAENPNDLSVYWVPTLLYQSGDNWEPVPVSRFSAYYGLGDTPAEIPIPDDVRMVAGDAMAQSADAMPSEANIEWFCENGPESTPDENGFPSETCSTHLQTLLYFPNCKYS